MIKGLIFDYGGTLDTNGCHWGKMIWHAYEHAGVPVSEKEFREAYVHAERVLGKNPIIGPCDSFLTVLTKKISIQLEYLRLEGFVDVLVNDLYAQVQMYTAEAVKVLDGLKNRYPLVLVSNFYGNIHTVLDEFGLQHVFSHVIESAVVGVRKPDPQIFRLGVEALGLRPSEVMVIGDSIDKDMIPAHSIGCHTLWLRGEGWVDAPSDLSAVDSIIDDFHDVLVVLSHEFA